MKPNYLTVFAVLFSMTLQAQEGEMRYIFSDKDYHISGFGAPIVEFSSYDGEFAVYNGGGGAVIFNNTFYIGGFGMGMTTEHRFPTIYNDYGEPINIDYNVEFGYGGLWVGYIFMPNNPIHFGISSKFGMGALSLYDSDFEYDENDRHNDFVGVITPQAEVEMNLTRWFKISFGAGYRFVTGIGNETYRADALGTRKEFFKEGDFNAPFANITFLFGGFGPKKK